MNDEKIFSKARFPFGAALCGAAGIVLVACGIAFHNVHPVLGAILPLALGAGLWLCREGRFEADLTSTGLRVAETGAEIPYDSIQSLTMDGSAQDPYGKKSEAGPLIVVHRDGVLQVPERLNVPSLELYRGLLSRVPMKPGGAGGPQLAQHLEQERRTFGADQVWAFQGRRVLGRRPSTVRSQVFFLIMAAAGTAWLVLAAVLPRGKLDPPDPWMVFGTILLVVGLVVWLFRFLAQRHPAARIRKRDQASLVISPSGLAMVQGDMKGRVGWDELWDVRLRDAVHSFSLGGESGPEGIHLIVEGARILVGDIYDRPLPLIYGRIRRYWQTHRKQQDADE